MGFSQGHQSNRPLRNQLAAYTIKTASDEGITTPSHINLTDFIISAGDKFDYGDHLSLPGTKEKHDTVIIVF